MSTSCLSSRCHHIWKTKLEPKLGFNGAGCNVARRAAVDTAVKLATMYNIQPIRGSTLVIVDGTNCMEPVSGRTRSIGQGITTGEVATLLALMFRHACEDCDFVVSFWRLGCSTFPGLVEGKVLANVATVYSHMIRGRGKSEDGPYVGVAWLASLAWSRFLM